ncbi:MAG: chromosome partitioning protein [Actinomycetota bacterium]|nr:chromosome partitioning protein [Actinomycetota bacterium]
MIAVGSVRSGGATTLALALAACTERAVLVEADADGGVLALRYGLSREPGLLSLAATRQPAGDALLEHAQRLPGGLAVVVAPESPEQSTRLLRSAGSRLATVLGGAGDTPIVVDAGRLSPSSPALGVIEAAATVLVVVRPRADELVAGAERVAALGERAALVLVGSGPYSANDVAAQLGCPVIGTVADDPRAARSLAEGGSASALTRSALVRSVRTLATALAGATGRPGAPVAGTHERSGVPA